MICYDVEIVKGPEETEGGWENPEGMGFGTAVAYDMKMDLYRFYGPDDADLLAQDLATAGRVISFNGIKFDNRVVLGNVAGLTPPWENIDLLVEVIKGRFGVDTVKEAEEKVGRKRIHDGSCGLNKLCLATVGAGKIGHGAHAPKLLADEKWAPLFAYNLHDVRLTVKLYRFAAKHGYVVTGHGEVVKLPGLVEL